MQASRLLRAARLIRSGLTSVRLQGNLRTESTSDAERAGRAGENVAHEACWEADLNNVISRVEQLYYSAAIAYRPLP